MGNWVALKSGVTQQLNHVWGFGALNTWAVGAFGTILYWNGQTWARQASGNAQQLNRVWGASSATGAALWVAGAGGTLLTSTNPGATAPWNTNTALNVAAGFAGNYVGVWGSSTSDFWVVEGGSGAFWHTTNGGIGWTNPYSAPAAWQHIWGYDANHIFAVGTTGATAMGVLAWWNGIGWTSSNLEAQGTADGLGVWPYGPSAQVFTAGFLVGGAAGGTNQVGRIGDWTIGFTGHVYDAAQNVLAYNAVYGADLVNLYAVGAGASGSYAISQVVSPAGTPAATGTWTNIALPASLATGPSGGFLGVFADGSGFAAAVRVNGAIAARPGATMTLQSVIAVATNRARVSFAAPPLAQSALAAGD